MKKLLGIIVLGLLLSGNAYAKDDIHQVLLKNELVVLYEGEEWSLKFLANNKMLSNWKGETTDKFTWKKLGKSGLYEIKHQNTNTPQYWEINLSNRIFKITDTSNVVTTHTILKPKDERAQKIEMASMINKAKDTCKSLGFKEGTEKFADCSLKLYSQSVELAAEQNKQVVMQPQSSGSNVITIYDPVRDSNALMNKGMKMLSGKCTLGIDC